MGAKVCRECEDIQVQLVVVALQERHHPLSRL